MAVRQRTLSACAGLLVALALAPAGAAARGLEDRFAAYVDPMIGTLGSGFVFPGPAAPYGMVQLSPDTDGYFAYTGYLWSDHFIRGFSHVHVQGMGVRSSGDVPFMPTVGPVLSSDPARFQSKFNHATEEARAGYYRVRLDSYAIDAELTAGRRVGMHRYRFPPSPQANVLIDAGRSVPGAHPASVDLVDDRTVAGTAQTAQGYTVHFAARFDRPFTGYGGWDAESETPRANVRSVSGNGAGAYVSFDTTADRDVLAKVGISFVSRANAFLNLDTEQPGWDFDGLRASTRAAWNRALGTIDVRGGSRADRKSFYTALYHAQHHPNLFSDANGEYAGHDGRVHVASGRAQYANFSLWDTYHGQTQLLAMLQPRRYRDMVRSLMAIHNEAGRLPRWALMNALPDYMPGDPVQQTVVDGFCRGALRGIDADELYGALRHNAFAVREQWSPGYLQRGWVGHDEDGGGASATLEYAQADFALALMADALGRTGDRDVLLERAGNYRHLIDPETGWVRPRYAGGAWMSPYLPESPEGFVEGTGWQYTWLAPQDLRGLFDRIGRGRGGDRLVRDRLDTFFSTALNEVAPYGVPDAQKLATLLGVLYVGNQYAPSNEHDLHAPYLYDYAGEPWKTQAIVRAYQGLFRPLPDGIPGNDDLGSMSAWFVWSALGFYPVTPGAAVYAIGSPVFEEARIRSAGSAFDATVRAPGASLSNKYVQAASLGHDALNRSWITHEELRSARRVELVMGPRAAHAWASGPDAAPPSLSADSLRAFGCAPGT